MKKAMIIINPTSGGEKALSYKNKIVDKFSWEFDEVDVRITEKAHDATEFASYAAEERYDTVVAFGGDGTVNEVIAGIAEREYIPKLGIIPGGTGNLLARVVGIDTNIDKAIENFDFTQTKKVDIGKSNEFYFGYILSIGSVPEAIHNVTITEKTKFGPLAYAVNAMKSMIGDSLFDINIQTENGSYIGPASQIIVLLTQYLGDKQLFEGDRDGYGNILILKDSSMLSKLHAVPDLIKGQVVENNKIEYIRAKNIEISTNSDAIVETDVDGDRGADLPIKVKILKQHIDVYCKDK